MQGAFNQENHEFAVYSSRRRLGRWAVYFLIMTLLTTIIFLVILAIDAIVFFQSQMDLAAVITFFRILMTIITILAFFLVILILSPTISTMRRFVSRKPALLITPEGIDFRDLRSTGTIFFVLVMALGSLFTMEYFLKRRQQAMKIRDFVALPPQISFAQIINILLGGCVNH